MAKVTPSLFVRQVRQEGAKVAWPSRKETGISTLMVLIMVAVASTFFLIVDQGFGLLVKWIFGWGV